MTRDAMTAVEEFRAHLLRQGYSLAGIKLIAVALKKRIGVTSDQELSAALAERIEGTTMTELVYELFDLCEQEILSEFRKTMSP